MPGGKLDLSKVAATAGLGALVYGAVKPDSKVGEFIGAGSGASGPIGYTGGIPEFGINRTLVPNAFSTTMPTGEPRIPGSAGRQYFTDTTYTPTGETMAAERLSPVNAPVTTKAPEIPETQEQRVAKAQGIINSLPLEVAQYLFGNLFSGTGISSAGDDAGDVVGDDSGDVVGDDAGDVVGDDAAKVTTTTDFKINTAAPVKNYTDASVKELIDFRVQQAGGDRVAAHRAIANDIAEKGISVEQVSKITGFKPEEILADYTAFGKFSDTDVLDFIKSTYDQYGGAGVDAHRTIAAAMKKYGVSPAQVARVTGYDPKMVEADYKGFGYARGGNVSAPQSRGYYLGGATDGMADQIPATIDGTQQAALSDGEFVVPADVVSHLGNGNSDAGAKQLYSMMDRVRQARTGRQEQGRKIAPNKFIPV
jgi:hypothetical protein